VAGGAGGWGLNSIGYIVLCWCIAGDITYKAK